MPKLQYQFTEEYYRYFLAESLRYVNFTKADRTLFPFEDLFYPMVVDEGKYAFLSYMEQMANTGHLLSDQQVPEELTHDRGKRDVILAMVGSLSQGLPITPPDRGGQRGREASLQTLEREVALDNRAENADIKTTGTPYVSPTLQLADDEEEKSLYTVVDGGHDPHEDMTHADVDELTLDDTEKLIEMLSSGQHGAGMGVTLPDHPLSLATDLSGDAKETTQRRMGYLPGGLPKEHRDSGDALHREHFFTTISPISTSDVDEDVKNQKLLEVINDNYGKQNATRAGTMDPVDNSNLLLIEPCRELRHSLSVPSEQGLNRLVLIASAGHGKSTLLRRLALYYCNTEQTSRGHQELQDFYCLVPNGEPIPCILYLRNVDGSSLDGSRLNGKNLIQAMLHESMMEVMWSGLQAAHDKGELPELPSKDSLSADTQTFLSKNSHRLLLLIDGLDELSEGLRGDFLDALESFLEKHSRVQVVITSRVAGLLESVKDEDEEQPDSPKGGIMKRLAGMQFRGRSIIPLNDRGAQAYALRWINVTQPDHQKHLLTEALDKVLTQRKFAYLKTFMRTPLELLSVLKQLTRDMLSLNRCEMFGDMLWHLVTNHSEGVNNKQALFDDTMTLLSFIAYHMQMRERLYLTQSELVAMEDDLANLPFYTEILGEDYAEIPKVLAYLDDLAANVGIIERDERTNVVSYTFPIRSYQEFLCAYACTHLALDQDLTTTEVLLKHLDNNHWWGVINFALCDLQQNSMEEFDVVIRGVFAGNEQDELVRTVLESNPSITKEHALLLCQRFLGTDELSMTQRDLLMTCMDTKSAYLYPNALTTLHQYHAPKNPVAYVEALARAGVMQSLRNHQLSLRQLTDDLQSSSTDKQRIAACMVYVLVEASIGLSLRPYMAEARRVFEVSKEMYAALSAGAMSEDEALSLYCARSLVLLCMHQSAGCSGLDATIADDVKYALYRAIEKNVDVIEQMIGTKNKFKEVHGQLIALMDDLYALGVLTMATPCAPVPTNVPYMAMVMRGCRQAELTSHRVGQYLRMEAEKQAHGG